MFVRVIAQYFASPEFDALNPTSRRTRRLVIEDCLREPLTPSSKLIVRDCPYKIVNASHVLMWRKRKAGKPGAANNRLKYLSAMFGWAIEEERFKLTQNPCRDVKKIKYPTDGFHTWGVEELNQYAARHPLRHTG